MNSGQIVEKGRGGDGTGRRRKIGRRKNCIRRIKGMRMKRILLCRSRHG
jgi:hypothetical protein